MSNETPTDPPTPRPRRERPPEPDTFNGFALAAVLCAVPAFVLGPVTGIPALICGFVALRSPYGRTAATVGISLSLVGMVTFVLALAIGLPRVREAAKRVQDAENLHEIGFALHQQHSWRQALPPAGGPISWRCYIVNEFADAPEGARGFNASEAWDGPTNAPRAAVSVRQFVSSGLPKGATETRYRTFVGGNAISMPGGRGIPLIAILDGTANTFYAVEATESVPWAQPKELNYRADAPLPPLGTPGRDGFTALLADGSVKWVKRTTTEYVLRAFITHSGNEIASLDP